MEHSAATSVASQRPVRRTVLLDQPRDGARLDLEAVARIIQSDELSEEIAAANPDPDLQI